METVKNIAAVLGLISVTIALITVGFPSLRTKFSNWIHKSSGNNDLQIQMDSLKNQMTDIKKMLEEHTKSDVQKQNDVEAQKEALKCILRDSITRIYYKNLSVGEIKTYEFEDLTHLKDAYDSLKGNSYVQGIYDQMTQEWKVVK